MLSLRLCCSHSLVISKPLIGFVRKLSLSSPRNVSQSSTRNLCLCVKRPIEPNGPTSSQNHTPHDSPLSGMEEVLGSYVSGKKKATEVAHLSGWYSRTIQRKSLATTAIRPTENNV